MKFEQDELLLIQEDGETCLWLRPGGRMVANAVSIGGRHEFDDVADGLGHLALMGYATQELSADPPTYRCTKESSNGMASA